MNGLDNNIRYEIDIILFCGNGNSSQVYKIIQTDGNYTSFLHTSFNLTLVLEVKFQIIRLASISEHYNMCLEDSKQLGIVYIELLEQ